MSIQFPGPDATYSEINSFYAEHGITRSPCMVAEEAPAAPAWYDIDGAEYCDAKCRGWDGKSSRCDCGYYRCHFTGDAPGAVGIC